MILINTLSVIIQTEHTRSCIGVRDDYNNLFNDLEELSKEYLRLWDGNWIKIEPAQCDLLMKITKQNSLCSIIEINNHESYEMDTKDPQSFIELLHEKIFVELKNLGKANMQ